MATEYVQIAGLIGLRTTYSDGEPDLESLVRLAESRGFDLLFINDHDRVAMEYGLFPLRHILKKEILFAMNQRRMYAYQGNYPKRMVLNDFSVSSSMGETKATSGEEIVLKENPRIHVSLTQEESSDNRITVRLIRSGKLIETLDGPLPMDINPNVA
jgi:hypothetical protein